MVRQPCGFAVHLRCGAATEAALTASDTMITGGTNECTTTVSVINHCLCC